MKSAGGSSASAALGPLVTAFSSLAIVTSIIGFTYGLVDAWTDARYRGHALAHVLCLHQLHHFRALGFRRAVRANISASAEHLRHCSELLERLIRENGLLVIGAEYSLETGEVDFFDGLPPG